MPLEDPGSRTGAEDNSKRQPRTTRGGFNLLLFSTAFEEFWHLIFWTTSQFESPVLSGYGRYDIRDERHRLESNKKVKESPVLAEGPCVFFYGAAKHCTLGHRPTFNVLAHLGSKADSMIYASASTAKDVKNISEVF